MKLRSFFVMTLAALAMVACNKDELNGVPNGSNSPGTPDGEMTNAVFALKMNDGGMRAAGSEGIVTGSNEATIQNAGIFIFKNDGTGKADQMKTVLKADLTDGSGALGDGSSKIPTVAMPVGAGKKHIVVVTNMTTNVQKALTDAFKLPNQTFEEFHKVYTQKTMGTVVTDPRDNVLIKTGDKVDAILMSGMIEAELKNGISATEAALDNNPNNLKITIDRAVAKFDLKLNNPTATTMNVAATFDKGGTPTSVGTVANWAYAMGNIAWEQYVRQQPSIGEFVATPSSAFSSATPVKLRPVFSEAKYDYVLAVTANTDYTKNKAFIMENTNEVARVHNSTYAIVKANYVPAPELYVSGINNATDGANAQVAWVKEAAPIIAGQTSLFCFEKNIAFKATASTAVGAGDFRATAIMNFAVDPAYKDLGLENSQIVKAGAFGSVGTGIVDIATFSGTNIKDAENIKSIIKYANDNKATLKSRLVFSVVTQSGVGEVKKYTMSSIVVSRVGDADFSYNNSVGVETVTFGFYKTQALGLECYYRINVFDVAFGLSHKMYNSVLRNSSYHANITKINAIGFAEAGDVIVKPEDPLNVNTHVQVVVTVNKWTAKQMDTELGQ